MKQFIKVSRKGTVATILIDRPQALNALNSQVLLELRSSLIELEGVMVTILTGGGDRAFVAGADIASLAEMDVLAARTFSELGHGVMQTIEEAPFLTIAAVNGFALGGGLELALSCDFIYSSRSAKFGLPETNLGLIPGFGGTLRLLQRVGFSRALEMILSGRTLNSEEALQYGLILEVFEDADLQAHVLKRAAGLAQKGILSLLAARRLVRQNSRQEAEKALLLERETFAGLFASDESKEGLTAFLEKRPPKFAL